MDLFQALQWRYAVRQFSDKTLPEQSIAALLEAARLAPSSFGIQPYRLLVVASKAVRQQLLPYSFGQQKVVDCSHLIIFAAETSDMDRQVDAYAARVVRSGRQSAEALRGYVDHMKSALSANTSEQRLAWAHQQAYIALGTLLTAAAVMGIDSCPMGGIDAAGYDRVLQLKPKSLTTSFVCALGERHAADESAQAPKVRKSLDELVLWLNP